MDEEKVCPKCGTAMRLLESSWALPGYVEKTSAKGQTTSTPSFPVEVYWCTGCHFIELYAETL